MRGVSTCSRELIRGRGTAPWNTRSAHIGSSRSSVLPGRVDCHTRTTARSPHTPGPRRLMRTPVPAPCGVSIAAFSSFSKLTREPAKLLYPPLQLVGVLLRQVRHHRLPPLRRRSRVRPAHPSAAQQGSVDVTSLRCGPARRAYDALPSCVRADEQNLAFVASVQHLSTPASPVGFKHLFPTLCKMVRQTVAVPKAGDKLNCT